MGRSITIVGGGIAGLVTGILLRKSSVPVELWEAGSYPRHRVCGEFISGRGLELLKTLGLPPHLFECTAKTVRFFHESLATEPLELPEAACSISRYELDAALARSFRESGGVLFEKQRWTGPLDLPGIVRATGRRLQHAHGATSRVSTGLKVHARNFPLSSDLELHFSPNGYVGISKLPNGETNFCGLLANVPRPTVGAERKDGLSRLFESVLNSHALENCHKADFDAASFCAVGGISHRAGALAPNGECRIGDSIAMIAPLTGNGMSLAIESAFAATPLLAAYSKSEMDWAQARRRISQLCDKQFRVRLQSSSYLQTMLSSRLGRKWMMSTFRTVPGVLLPFFRLTR
jgi:flavin-dependent dehydrogenase